MKTNPTSQTANTSVEETAVLAYTIWEQEGRPHGRDFEHWMQAELLLKAVSQKAPPSSAKEAMTIVRAGGNGKSPSAQRGIPSGNGRTHRAELVAR